VAYLSRRATQCARCFHPSLSADCRQEHELKHEASYAMDGCDYFAVDMSLAGNSGELVHVVAPRGQNGG